MSTEINIDDPTVAPLPPSCKLVYLALEAYGPAPLSTIRARTTLADRTAREALDTLVEEGVATRDWATDGDARQSRYRLAE